MSFLFKRHPYWFICTLFVISTTFYWSLIATDRYISEANVVLESPDISASSFNFSSILSGGGGSKDLLLLRDHLLSVDMLKKLNAEFDLRSHYANTEVDFFSRLDNKDAPLEIFHNYYLSRIEAVMDDYSGVLRIRVHAFDPQTAHKIATALLLEGEKHMNNMGQRLASEQVGFIETQVEILANRLNDSREAILEYQNKHGLISPAGTVESLTTVVASLESELSQLKTQKTVLNTYQSSSSPDMLRLDSEIDAIQQQITAEQSRMATTSGGALNRISAEYETLQLKTKFSLDLYSNALAALENTRVEAIRKLKQVSILQTPTIPEYSIEPRRSHNIAVFTILAILASIITHLISAIIRDHRD
tara:strand:+ start:2644 stop:3729 length:1086 start_codon:yes stop_codon:yes gene_type:complete